METTERSPISTAEPVAPPATLPPRSQSKISPILLWLLLAAALLRVVTAVTSRGDAGSGAGLVNWMSPTDAAQAARASGKPILYDFTAEWCGPCKALDADGWADGRVAAYVNESFVPARVMDRARSLDASWPTLDELQQKYRVNAFPTLVVAAPDGREIATTQGYAGKQRLMAFLSGARGNPSAAP